MRRIVIATTVLFALSVPLMAFGGGSGGAPAAGSEARAIGADVWPGSTSPSPGSAAVEGFVTGAQPSGTAPGTARVVVGTSVYEFDVTDLCVNHPETRVLGVAEDGSTLLADFPVTGPVSRHGDPASIVIHLASGGSWVADAAAGFDVPDGSVIHSWERDGATVTGSGAFGRVRTPGEAASRLEAGTFRITCP